MFTYSPPSVPGKAVSANVKWGLSISNQEPSFGGFQSQDGLVDLSNNYNKSNSDNNNNNLINLDAFCPPPHLLVISSVVFCSRWEAVSRIEVILQDIGWDFTLLLLSYGFASNISSD